MTARRLLPSQLDAETLAELLDDARAIPAAAYPQSRGTARGVIDLTMLPTQRAALQISAATAALAKAFEDR